ncbi:MAG: hypothetical protein M1816_002547 [Peltula sp. TS41687]|nr:MAG: hypothetical protein M1816_002547 [Peltula sp. TS41687]
MAPTARYQIHRAGRSIVRHHGQSSSTSPELTEEDSEALSSSSSNISDSEEWLPNVQRKRKTTHQMTSDAVKRPKVFDLGRRSTSAWNQQRRYSANLSASPDAPASPIIFEQRRSKRKSSGLSQSSIIFEPQPKKRKTASRAVTRAPKRGKSVKNVDEKSQVVSPLQTLPYHVLLQIFIYAAQQQDPRQANWLIGVSRLCGNFTEPALTALYQHPPLLSSGRAHNLLSHLNAPMDNMLLNYRNKIQCLDMDVTQTLQIPRPGGSRLDLGNLVSLAPRLRHLNLYRADDGPPYPLSITGRRWTYPDELFSALEATGVRLRSWTWHGRLCSSSQMTAVRIKEIHGLSSFQGLVRLTLRYMSMHHALVDTGSAQEVITTDETLRALPNLKYLTCESCSIVDDDNLVAIPTNLTTLTLINCPGLTSTHLERYLDSDGSQLKELVLKHNESLNLSFLPSLARSCPQLEVLSMDFQFYGSDMRGKFEVLLLPGEIPTWPSSLHTLDLVYLRKWSVETAEMFLQSLIDSAPNLPRLRYLILKAILQCGWRDRAEFRDKWPRRMRSVFLQGSDESDAAESTHITGTRRRCGHESRSNKKKQANGRGGLSQQDVEDEQSAPPHRNLRSSRKQPVINHTDEDSGMDSDDIPLKQKLGSWKATTTVSDPGMDSDDLTLKRKLRSWKATTAVADPPKTSYRTRAKTELERLALCAGSDRPGLNDATSLDSRTNGSAEGMQSTSGGRKRKRDEQGEEVVVDVVAEPAAKKFKQGMCDVVEVTIDNIRPTANQYRMEDFLDAEQSGDEDWNGEDPVQADDRYAW